MDVYTEKIRVREEDVRVRKRSLDRQHLLHYRKEITKTVKDPDTYAVLVYCLGLGIHHL